MKPTEIIDEFGRLLRGPRKKWALLAGGLSASFVGGLAWTGANSYVGEKTKQWASPAVNARAPGPAASDNAAARDARLASTSSAITATGGAHVVAAQNVAGGAVPNDAAAASTNAPAVSRGAAPSVARHAEAAPAAPRATQSERLAASDATRADSPGIQQTVTVGNVSAGDAAALDVAKVNAPRGARVRQEVRAGDVTATGSAQVNVGSVRRSE